MINKEYKNLEKGYVFLDDKNDPYFCTMWYSKPWLFYWHKNQKSWVSLRELVSKEVADYFFSRRLSDTEAEIYHTMHNKFIGNNEKN